MKDLIRLESIAIRGFRALEDVRLPLGALNVMIGPNGVGKSSFLDVFSLMAAALGERNRLGKLISQRGGIGRILTLGRATKVEFELITTPLDRPGKTPSPLKYSLSLIPSGVAYAVAAERLSQEQEMPNPFLFLERRPGKTLFFDPAQRGLVEMSVPPGELAIAEVPPTIREPVIFCGLLATAVHHRETPVDARSPIRTPQTLQPTTTVASPGGGDLNSVLYKLRLEQPDWYERIQDAIRSCYPGFQKLDFPVVAGGQVTLAWFDSDLGSVLYANELSDGTLRFLTLVTLLLSPDNPPLLLIDEPEASLHPELLRVLAELLVEASARTQIIVATQSPSLLRWLKPEHVIVADREGGTCRLTRAADIDLEKWLAEYSLDDLWAMGKLGGQP